MSFERNIMKYYSTIKNYNLENINDKTKCPQYIKLIKQTYGEIRRCKICMYMYTCIYTVHVCMYSMCIYTVYAYKYVCVCVYTLYVCMCVHAVYHVYVHMHAYSICIYVHMCICSVCMCV